MKQSYVKTAEEAIKKAEAVQYRFLTQEEFGSGQVPDSVWEAGALEEQLDSLHRIARIDQEKAAGKLKERLCGVKRAKSRRLRILRLAVAAAAAILVGMCLYLWVGNRAGYSLEGTYVREEKVTVPTVFRERDEKTIDRRALEMRETGNTYVVTAETLPPDELLAGESVVYERVVIPVGYTCSVSLPDGSAVVLNAGSELRFPGCFCDSVREVELKGEGYFEVAHSGCPFIVRAGETKVTVYGTRFNLFYSDRLTVTEAVLVEGSIGLMAGGKETKIRPNQRIRYDSGEAQLQVEEVDADDYIQWLTNNFKYRGARLDRIAFDLAAWYGVEIEVAPEIAVEVYSLEFGKELSLDEVVWALRKITGRTVKKEGGVYRIE